MIKRYTSLQLLLQSNSLLARGSPSTQRWIYTCVGLYSIQMWVLDPGPYFLSFRFLPFSDALLWVSRRTLWEYGAPEFVGPSSSVDILNTPKSGRGCTTLKSNLKVVHAG